MNAVRLIEGSDFVATKRWAMVLQRDVCYRIPDLGADYGFYSGKRLLGYHDRDGLTICEGYALDGYSPVVRIFGRWVKLTPVPKRAGHGPDVLHDFTRQFLTCKNIPCPWTRKDTDDWLFDALVAGGESEAIAGGYHCVVAGPVGTGFIAMTRKADPSLRIERHPYHP